VFLAAFSTIQPGRVPLLAVIVALSMTLENLVAIWQKNIKCLLVYSSIAQVGYILMGLTATFELG
jgi:NADH-quinone oxidoreductase subunit N